MKKLITLLLSLLTLNQVFAANVSISGQAPSYVGKQVVLFELSDAISNREKVLAQATVDSDGNFKIQADIASTCQATLSVDRVVSTLFLSPGQSYQVAFPNLASNQVKSFGGNTQVQIVFFGLEKDDPNFQISRFNEALEQFNRENLAQALSNNYLRQALDFWRSAQASYDQNPFTSHYVRFACATNLLNAGMPQKKVNELFLDSIEPNIKNPEFGNFLAEFFPDLLPEMDRITGDEQMKITVNIAPRAFKLLEELKKNDYLQDLHLREIVALQSLNQLFNKEGYNKENILDLIEQIGLRTIYEDVKTLSQNLHYQLQWLKPGYPLPEINLQQYNGEVFRNQNVNGKPTLYVFWAPWSRPALDELVNLALRQQIIGDKINYVLISVGEEAAVDTVALQNIAGLKGIKTSYLKQPSLIDELRVVSIPHFMLVDKDGKVLKHYAASVDNILPSVLATLKSQE